MNQNLKDDILEFLDEIEEDLAPSEYQRLQILKRRLDEDDDE